jgi:predicted nucleotidyltransferase
LEGSAGAPPAEEVQAEVGEKKVSSGMEKLLGELVEKLKAAAGANLQAVALYGSAARGDYHPKHSDLNVLCMLHQTSAPELRKLHNAVKWWERKRHPAPLIFTLEEIRSAADVYAIELLEIKRHRRMLYGDDLFASLEVPLRLHRLQVERELRDNLIRLRQAYISVAERRKELLPLMLRSASTFGLLFRHALMALGEEPPVAKHEAVEKLTALLGFDATSFKQIHEIRAGLRKPEDPDIAATFANYLEAVTQAVNELDKRFDALNQGNAN